MKRKASIDIAKALGIGSVLVIGGFHLLLALSRALASRGVVGCCLQSIGDALMIIMYLHVAVLNLLSSGGASDPCLQVAIAVGIPLAIHSDLSRVPSFRLRFLGTRPPVTRKLSV